MWKIRGKYFEDMWTICGRYLEGMLKICGRYVENILKICGRYVEDMCVFMYLDVKRRRLNSYLLHFCNGTFNQWTGFYSQIYRKKGQAQCWAAMELLPAKEIMSIFVHFYRCSQKSTIMKR